jgi:UDP-galactose-lipid carrier transferase
MFSEQVEMPGVGTVSKQYSVCEGNVPATAMAAGSRWKSLGSTGTYAAAIFGADLIAFVCSVPIALSVARAADVALWASPHPIGLSSLKAALPKLAVWSVIFFAYLDRSGHYRTRVPFWSQLRQIIKICAIVLLGEGFIEFSTRDRLSRQLIYDTWLLMPFLVVSCRQAARWLLSQAGLWELHTIIVGDARQAVDARRALASEPSLGYRVVGVLPPSEALGRIKGAGADSLSLLSRFNADLLILAPDEDANGEFRDIVAALSRGRVAFAIVPQLQGAPVWGCDQVSFFSHDTVLLRYRNNLRQPLARAVKIIFDLSVASFVLLLCLPVFLIVAVLNRREGGSALFAHTRIGANGRRFRCFKFRTMVVDAERVLCAALAADPELAAEWAATRKLRSDPRVTPIGRFLRATSIDELPQLFNVLRLDMSLVGPRPIVDQEVDRYGRDIAYYYDTRPGITGLWQVSGRSDTTYEERVQLDSWYVRNWTLWHDITILAKTFPAVLRRRGAC